MRFVFLDTETTGLYHNAGDKIVEIGCVEMLNRKLTENNLHFYINPERDSHEEALRVHGLTPAFLKDKPKFSEVAQQIIDFCKGATIVIHNAPFDLGFLNKEYTQLNRQNFVSQMDSVMDTLVLAKEMYPGKRNNLNALCDRLDVDRSCRTLHGALLDAQLLADVYLQMTRGQKALMLDAEPELDATTNINDATKNAMNGEGTKFVEFFADHNKPFVLPIYFASTQETELHCDYLSKIDKDCKEKTIWRQFKA